MKLITVENRVSKLLKFGAPKIFIENIGKVEELDFQVEDVEMAYFYLPQISNYKIIKDFSLIPIFCSGETFYVYAYNDQIEKIIYFELENDQIYTNYEQNWNLLLMDIMIQYFESEIDDGIEVIEFKNVGEKIAFDKAEQLFHLLNLSVEEYNIKFNEKEKWRTEIAQKLNIL